MVDIEVLETNELVEEALGLLKKKGSSGTEDNIIEDLLVNFLSIKEEMLTSFWIPFISSTTLMPKKTLL